MTYKEMLAQIDPESIDDDNIGGRGCPEDYGREWLNFQGDECHCNDDTCRRCWSQEIPGTGPAEAQTSIKDSGDRTQFYDPDGNPIGRRDMHAGKGRMDLLPWEAIIEVAKHCEEGALKYGEHNVDKGIPIHSLVDSAFRHLAKYTMGMTDEPHLRAAAWNLLWALYMEAKHPELQDIPTRQIWEDKTDSGLLEE